jgi:hypothetical protein
MDAAVERVAPRHRAPVAQPLHLAPVNHGRTLVLAVS